MKYYFFLNAQNPRQGPHSLTELAEKIGRDEVSLQTLVCREGDNCWYTLEKALYDSTQTPKRERSILEEWQYCITRSFCFRGRASRREFWAFTLINSLPQIVFCIWIMVIVLKELSYRLDILNGSLLMYSDIEELSQELNIFSLPGVALPLNLLIAFTLLSIIPTLSASWRRLHDTGRSGLLALVIALPFVGSFIYLFFTCSKSENQVNAYGPPPQ